MAVAYRGKLVGVKPPLATTSYEM